MVPYTTTRTLKRLAWRCVAVVMAASATAAIGVVSAAAMSQSAHPETTGGVTHTWTNYTNAGGTQGPSIPAYSTVQIECKVPGFKVADGNTWWYRIASSPWNSQFYASADAFYNNGQTSGSLHGTPFVDPNVPDCGAASPSPPPAPAPSPSPQPSPGPAPSPSPSPPPHSSASPSAYVGHIVQWSGDKKAQKTAWYVGPDLHRRWIHDISTYNCLKAAGAQGPDLLASSMLDQLPDLNNVWATCGADRLGVNSIVTRGSYLRSQDGGYTLNMQGGDGNLALYSSSGRPLWATDRHGDYLMLQPDGNLVEYTNSKGAVWASNTVGSGAAWLVMQDDGNLVLYNSAGRAVWSSGTAGGHTSGGSTAAETAAVAWAQSHVGQDYDYNLCLKFVFDAYYAAGLNLRPWVNAAIGNNTYPIDIWGHFTHGSTGTSTTPPAGALVFWAARNGRRDWSHVALSIGNGQAVSTSDSLGSRVHVESTSAHNSYANYLGWWLPDR